MTKSTFLFVYIILILGSMVNEIQGQNAICQKFLSETDCGAGSCTALCLQLWKGIGKCSRRGKKGELELLIGMEKSVDGSLLGWD
ncbi:hypothetical protein AXX17_AT5G45560 [Arabidopsis thaliana]|uniref:Uncharacterized protein n=1 Tax=Arabidopsis thaliana TaxID=3702 RepID=A0A178UCY3_ARATH|nr:hypothetical protein AXX17_AT5G45560 [Arabidopsis thaliana]